MSVIPQAERPYLLDPVSGYPLTLDPVEAEQVRALFKQMTTGGDPTVVGASAADLAAAEPSLLAASVLVAQARFLEGRDQVALLRLAPVIDELPGYLAAVLLAGRASERLGHLEDAYLHYASVAEDSYLARERAADLRPQVADLVVARFDDALSRGRFDDAEEHLARLAEWFGEEDLGVLEARWRLLAASGDEEGELEVVRRLAAQDPRPEVERRLGELEVGFGDVRSGLEIFERLVAADPTDAEMADWLARAKFLWRLDLLPPEVQAMGRQGELDRAELATFLYWLYPDVRYSAVDEPPIAADILEHERRQEILRVLDVGLMSVDRALHRFRPEDPATRADLLAALLGLAMSSEPPLPCLRDEVERDVAGRPRSWVCAKATECGLIEEDLACLPSAALAGPEALEMVRTAQDLTGAR